MENNDYYEPTIRTSREKKEAHLYYSLTSSKESWRKETLQLRKEKQQLISFLEDKIKLCDKDIKEFSKKYNVYFDIIRITKAKLKTYRQVLDFVNKGGKDE